MSGDSGDERRVAPAGPQSRPASLRVLRLTSVYEPPPGTAVDPRFDPVGGMQSHTGRLTRALDRRGVAQQVVTAWRPGAARREPVGDFTVVHRVGGPLTWLRQGYAVPAAPLVRRLAASVDVVHAHLGEDLAVVPLAALAAGRHTPLVLTVHCSLAHTLAVIGPRGVVLRLIGAPVERWGERRADAVVVLTERLRSRLAGGGVAAERITVIPSGVEFSATASPGRDREDPLANGGRPRVVFVGRLAPQKDPAALVEALPRMNAAASLVLVGDGPLRRPLERLAARLGVGDRVTVTGFVAPDTVRAHLAHADVFALPSRYEELGSALVEAMAAGLPAVATAVGGIPEVVVDGVTGRLVPADDTAALAEALDGLLADAPTARRMGEAARARAAGYHWDALAARVHALYESVLSPTGRLDPAARDGGAARASPPESRS